MKKYLLLFIFGLSCIVAKTQTEKFNDIYKLCQAGNYNEAVLKLYSFIKANPSHIPANYELAKYYKKVYDQIKGEANAKVDYILQNHSKDIKDLLECNNLYEKFTMYGDSSIYFYKKTSEFMNETYLLSNFRYKEFQITCSNMTSDVCVKNYLNTIIQMIQDAQMKNKNDLKMIKETCSDYDKNAFENYCQQTITDQYCSDPLLLRQILTKFG